MTNSERVVTTDSGSVAERRSSNPALGSNYVDLEITNSGSALHRLSHSVVVLRLLTMGHAVVLLTCIGTLEEADLGVYWAKGISPVTRRSHLPFALKVGEDAGCLPSNTDSGRSAHPVAAS
jgi:hypothetical protein